MLDFEICLLTCILQIWMQEIKIHVPIFFNSQCQRLGGEDPQNPGWGAATNPYKGPFDPWTPFHLFQFFKISVVSPMEMPRAKE